MERKFQYETARTIKILTIIPKYHVISPSQVAIVTPLDTSNSKEFLRGNSSASPFTPQVKAARQAIFQEENQRKFLKNSKSAAVRTTWLVVRSKYLR